MFRYSAIFLILTTSAGPLAAEAVSVRAIPGRVRAANPSLAAARLTIEEARGRLIGAGRRSNPEAGTELKPNIRGGEFSAGLSLGQKFPVTARLRLEKEVSTAELAKAEAEVSEVERLLIEKAQLAAVQWLSLSQLGSLRREQAANAVKLADFADEAAKRGEGPALDASQFRLEAAQLAYEVKQLAAQQTPRTGELRTLLGMQPDEPVSVTGSLGEASIAGRPGVLLGQRPDYRAKLHEQDAADKAVALEKSKKWEDLTAGAALEIERREDAPEGLKTDGFIGLRVSIPFPWWNRNEGKIHEAAARAERVRRETAALAAGIRNEAAAAHAAMMVHARLAAEASGTLLKQAEQQVTGTEDAWQKGQGKLTDVLRARDQLLKIRTSRLEAVRDYHLARIRLEAATGKHSPTSHSK